MAIEVRKKEGEQGNSLLYSFTRRVKRSGILRETRARRFHGRPVSRVKRKLSAIHRADKRIEMERQKRLGLA
jgi:ribosomal protein S21